MQVSMNRKAAVSLMISIGVAAILKYTVGVYLYLYICLINLLFYDKKKLPEALLLYYGACFLAPDAGVFFGGSDIEKAWTAFGLDMLYFLLGFFICILILEQVKQKENYEQISMELKKKNELLKQQQQLNEELALSRERELIAQELHDSIGHTLVAVKMYVKVLEKYVAADPDKEREILSTLNEVVQDGILQLRKTVYQLKEDRPYENLGEALEQLTQSVKHTQSVQISLSYDENLEAADPEIKADIYKSVREGITNSLKYAGAAHIWVALQKKGEEVFFSVKDDGAGAGDIRKSYGLLGIEERIKKWDGVCSAESGENKGFLLQVRLKLQEQNPESETTAETAEERR